MDSSEASFYGLYTASMENAAGNFVTPTVANLEAALAKLTPCPGGTLSCPVGTYKVDYTTPNADAYPMPDVTYAMVPTTPLSPSTATALKNLFDQHGELFTPVVRSRCRTGMHPCRPRCTRRPSPISQRMSSLRAWRRDIVDPDWLRSPTKGSGSSGGTTSGLLTGSTNPFVSTAGGTAGSGLAPSLYESPSREDGSHPAAPGPPVGPGGVGTATGFLLVGLDAAARYLLPALVILALAWSHLRTSCS